MKTGGQGGSPMERKHRTWKKRAVIIIVSVPLCATLAAAGLSVYGKAQMAKTRPHFPRCA